MKSKNIPADIKIKSIKEAQSELKGIIEKLENNNVKLEDSQGQYNRMMQLNHHIQERFKKKAKEIQESYKHQNKKKFLKDLK